MKTRTYFLRFAQILVSSKDLWYSVGMNPLPTITAERIAVVRNPLLPVTTERVDDIPLLLAFQKQMQVAQLLDTHFPTHGNWQVLSLGGVATGWLTHILSEADHRMNHVQDWTEQRLETLHRALDPNLTALDFSDDRLSAVLTYLADDERWTAFEADLNQNTLRVYDLNPDTVRLDTTSATGYWRITPDGLFQLGHSKDHRPDLPQVKVLLGVLDPLGMPVATLVVAGQRADDPLYVPAIERVRQGVGRRGLLYVGDCKMGALHTRAVLHAGDDLYLMPLSALQLPETELHTYLQPVWTGEQTLTPVYRPRANGLPELIAEGFERVATITAELNGQTLCWSERRLVVRSLRQARASEARLRQRLARAQAEIQALNQRGRGKRRFTSRQQLRQAAEAIVARAQLTGLLQLTYTTPVSQRRVRAYGQRPARVVKQAQRQVHAAVNETALNETIRALGWHVYATNAGVERLGLEHAVLAYRQEYLVEHGFSRVKGHPLSLTPTYLQRADHLTGLIRLLTIGLRILTLFEFVVRRQLAQEQSTLTGLYAGNSKRTTARPTAEQLLTAFGNITLTIIGEGAQLHHHLTLLSTLQQRILQPLGLSSMIYTNLAFDSS